MYLHVLASRSRWIDFHQKKVPEMEFSDKVDIKNAQVCCPTPSELGARVPERPSDIGQICSYPRLYNPVFTYGTGNLATHFSQSSEGVTQ